MWRLRHCLDCGKEFHANSSSRRCRECQERRNRDSHRLAEQRRRRTKSGRYQTVVKGWTRRWDSEKAEWVAVPEKSGVVLRQFRCLFCRRRFKPQRSTGKFCRPACRVAWHRKRKARGRPRKAK
jgi:hypothetical protein